MKVLIIDDSPDAVTIARARLTAEGLDIATADDGQAGLRAAAETRPDLILLDLDMPDVSGFDVCRRLKADPELCMIPVIFLAGSEDTGDKVRGLDLGAVDYVAKPFDAVELRARVRAALRTKRLQDLLMEFAQIDPLTELSNRRALTERLAQEWSRFHRHGGALSVIMADVDHFKRINDRFGHHVGDEVLRQVAAAIASQCRQSDLPARYGGEEFAVVVPGERAEQAAALAERCRKDLAARFVRHGGEHIAVTASFGVADAKDATDTDDLVERADRALYAAKQNGRNRVETGAGSTAGSPPIGAGDGLVHDRAAAL